jgi:hypothetical protein
MLQISLRLVGVIALAPILIGTFTAAAEPERSNSFKFTLASQMDMEMQGQKQKVDADTDLRYTWTQRADERTLSFDSALVKANMDGNQLMDVFMSREKFASTQGGTTEEVPFEKAAPELKSILEDSFSVPLCKLQMDKNGKELKREVVAGPGAKNLIDQGMVANAELFHPQFLPDKKEWSADAQISMGNGGFAKGKLAYKKAAAGKGGVPVKVSGTLTNEGFSPPGSPLSIKNAKYVVKGEQTYDPARRDWVLGKLVMDVSFEMFVGDNRVGPASGSIVASLATLPEKK